MSRTNEHRGASFLTVLTLLMAMMVLAVSPVAAATADLTAELSGDQEVPPVDTASTGSASVSVDTDAAAGSQLCFDVTSTDLEGGAVVGAHIHEGAEGENGPVVVTLQAVMDGKGTGEGCAADAEINISAEGSDDADVATFLADIIANPANYYVNVHTETFTGGEIRGQLEGAVEASAFASASAPAARELPDGALDATGQNGGNGIAILLGIMALASASFLGYRTVAVRPTR